MKKVFSIEFKDTNNPMVSNAIKMICSGCEHLIISKSDNFISLDASHVDDKKLLSLGKIFSETGFVKKFGLELVK